MDLSNTGPRGTILIPESVRSNGGFRGDDNEEVSLSTVVKEVLVLMLTFAALEASLRSLSDIEKDFRSRLTMSSIACGSPFREIPLRTPEYSTINFTFNAEWSSSREVCFT